MEASKAKLTRSTTRDKGEAILQSQHNRKVARKLSANKKNNEGGESVE